MNDNDPIKKIREQGAETTFFPPYALLIGLLGSSIIDSFLIHLPIFEGNWFFLAIGLSLAVTFFGIAIYTLKIFGDNDENAHPKSVQSQLFVGGTFQYSRNPIYLAIVIILLSCGIAFNSWWYILSSLISIPILTITVIIPEEKYLEKEFGKVYLDYKKSVRRWL
tara:strand:- start:103 stop:597 length:495 start_codon:yes stop_codon:yes gene_type:complete